MRDDICPCTVLISEDSYVAAVSFINDSEVVTLGVDRASMSAVARKIESGDRLCAAMRIFRNLVKTWKEDVALRIGADPRRRLAAVNLLPVVLDTK